MEAIQLPPAVREELEMLKRAIKQILGDHLKKIYLFGSYARQEANEESDLDLLVLTDLDGKALKNKEQPIWGKCADLFISYNVLPTVVLRNEEQFEERSQYIPFYMAVRKEGIVVYG